MKIKEFIFGCIFGFLFGFLIQHAYASYNTELNMIPKVENIQSLPTNVSYEVIYTRGHHYIVFSNGTGTDIEVQKID